MIRAPQAWVPQTIKKRKPGPQSFLEPRTELIMKINVHRFKCIAYQYSTMWQKATEFKKKTDGIAAVG